MKKITTTEKQTIILAQNLAKKLSGGEVLGLIGDLGAGKTVFTRGLAQGLGIKNNINSPTFVLMKVYPVQQGKIKNFVHIDAYRIKNLQDLLAIGIEDYLYQPDSIVVIEWADRIKLKKIKLIRIKNQGQNSRLIEY